MAGSHNAALLYGVVQQRQSCRGTVGTGDLQTHFLQDPGNTVAYRRSRRQAQIHNAKGNAQATGSLHAYDLTHTGDLEGGLFNGIGNYIKGLALYALQSMVNNARTGNAHVQDALRLTNAVESAGHKGVVLHCIGKNHQLCAAQSIVVRGNFRSFLNNSAHFSYGIHIDARLGRAHINTGADTLSCAQRLRNGADQLPITGSTALLHQSRKAADEVNAADFRCFVHSSCNGGIGICLASTGHQGNGGNRNALIDNGNTKFPLNILAHLH